MSIHWEGDLIEGLTRVFEETLDLSADVVDGAEVVLIASDKLVPQAPKHAGDDLPALVITGDVKPDGENRAAIVYDSPYAHWIHEHLWFHHPHGGQAKFLEIAMLEKGQEAINRAGENVFRRL